MSEFAFAFATVPSLRSEMITKLIPQKLFRAVIARISRNPARNNSSEVFWHNDKKAIVQINSWKHATKTVRDQRATKMRNRPENNSPRVSFTRLIVTILRNPSENDSSIIFFPRTMFSEWRVSLRPWCTQLWKRSQSFSLELASRVQPGNPNPII